MTSRGMHLFYSVVCAILASVMAYYMFLGLRTEQIRLSNRHSNGRAGPLLEKAKTPMAYWSGVALAGGMSILMLSMSVSQAKAFARTAKNA